MSGYNTQMQARMAERSGPSRVQCIGFGVYANGPTAYLGGLNDDEDFQTRLQMIKSAIESAHKNALPSEAILKVFVAPEFFWRGANPDGGVSVQIAWHILAELQRIACEEKYKNWVFVFGTVVTVAKDAGNADEQNFAPVIEGGPDGAKFICSKKYISNINFIGGCHQPEYDPLPDYLTKTLAASGWEIADNGIVRFGNVRASVEICLDHAQNEVKTEIQKMPWRDMPSLHIVTSCGMVLQNARDQTERFSSHCPIEFLQDGHFHFNAQTTLKENGAEKPPANIVQLSDMANLYAKYLGATFKKDEGDGLVPNAMPHPQLRLYQPIVLPP